jgi:hypothetical protein
MNTEILRSGALSSDQGQTTPRPSTIHWQIVPVVLVSSIINLPIGREHDRLKPDVSVLKPKAFIICNTSIQSKYKR